MRAIGMGVAVAAAASVLASGIALAQNVEEVHVQGKRALTTKTVGRTSSGIPLVEVSLSYDVSTAGVDPASSAGAAELARRVNAAAGVACKEISRQYPDATPSDAECANQAAGTAMVKVRELAAAGRSR
jgi:hypothetical protein